MALNELPYATLISVLVSHTSHHRLILAPKGLLFCHLNLCLCNILMKGLLIKYLTMFYSDLLAEAASLCTSETGACTERVRQDGTQVGSR